MSDPFSVTGSAVGVVSLGLTVCQGLVKYYAAYKGQDEEVDQAVEKVSRLMDLLEVLQPRLENHRAPHPVTVDQAEKCVIACSGAITNLNKVLQRCRRENTPDGVRAKIQTFGQKTLFPFRRDTMQTMRKAVIECQRNVDTAINILQM